MRTPKAMRWWRKPCNAARAQRRIVEVAGSPARAAPYCTLNCSFIVKKCALCGPRLASLSPTQDLNRLFQARQLGAPQIDLSNVACDHRGGAESDAREKHLHLLRRGVLRLVQDDKGFVQRPAAHVGQRGQLDHAFFEKARA